MATHPPPAGAATTPLRPDRPDAPVPAATAALALWLVLQLAAVLIAVLRIPLAAQYPVPAEQLAGHWVAGTQVVAGALLFPLLFRDRPRAAAVVASSWPFLLAGGYLAGLAARELAWCGAYVTGWLVTLALWAPLLRTRRAQMIGVALASLFTLGGAALGYLRLEFAAGRGDGGTASFSVSPLLSTFHLVEGQSPPAPWFLLAGLAVAAVATRGAIALRRPSSPRHSRPRTTGVRR